MGKRQAPKPATPRSKTLAVRLPEEFMDELSQFLETYNQGRVDKLTISTLSRKIYEAGWPPVRKALEDGK